jgi:hypothetical protein
LELFREGDKMKALEEMTVQEIAKAIDMLDRAMFAQPIAKQAEYAKAIGRLIQLHQRKIKREAK